MRRLFTFLRPSRGWLAATVLCLTAAAALESVGFSLFVPLITALTHGAESAGAVGSALFTSYVRFVEGVSSRHGVHIVVAALCVALVLKNVLGYAGRLLGAHVELRTVRTLRIRVFQAYLGSSYQFFLDRKQGRLVHDLLTETAIVGEVVTICTALLSQLITIAGLYLLLMLISWQATLIASGIFALLTVGLQGVSRLSKRIGALRQRMARDLAGLGTELILGIRQVKVFAAEPLFAERFRAFAHQLSWVNLRIRATSLFVEPLIELAALFVMVSLAVLATRGIIGGAAVQASVLVVFVVVLIRMLPLVGSLNKELIRLSVHGKSVEAVMGLLARAPQPQAPQRGRLFSELRDAIVFEGVGLTYPGRPASAALEEVTLSVPKGRMTAIVGPSGSGKSTLIDLIARLYEPTRGRILVDGVDVREHDLTSWRRAIGFVSQETFIFHASIRDNIAFAAPHAGDADIRWAARQADAHEFIQQLPQGYETVVGERGLKLSGGERQRIAIARAILRRPQILLFDEATSALDNASEQRVQEAITRISRDRTVIVVAHRLSTISRADTIVVLDQGRIVEQGTHQELMAHGGTYWALYRAEGAAPKDQAHSAPHSAAPPHLVQSAASGGHA